MRALLLSMPDIMPGSGTAFNQWPMLSLLSIAANAAGHEVLTGDLCLKRRNIVKAALGAIEEHKPAVLGLSAMSFQYYTARRLAEEVRKVHPELPMVLGGYHATLLYDELARGEEARAFDYLVRHEGERSFAMLLDALEGRGRVENVPGLSWKRSGAWVHNPPGELLDLNTLRPPDRDSRLWSGHNLHGGRVDVVETSRGCTMPCKFCSMRGMYGPVYRPYPLERVLDDIGDARRRGAGLIGLIDDNITLDVERFEALCDGIIRRGYDDIRYFVQVSSVGMGRHPRLVRKMGRAGFCVAFLGVENVSKKSLRMLAKGDIVEWSRRAIDNLQKNHIIIIGGLIVGNPDDEEQDIAENYHFFLRHGVDMYHDQILVPYPRTKLREELLEQRLVTNPDDYRYYSGFWANVRTRHLSSDDLQYLKWKYHVGLSSVWRKQSDAFRKAFPVVAMFRRLVDSPLQRFRQRLRRQRMTERETYIRYIRKWWSRTQFFRDLPPSPHLTALTDASGVPDPRRFRIPRTPDRSLLVAQ